MTVWCPAFSRFSPFGPRLRRSFLPHWPLNFRSETARCNGSSVDSFAFFIGMVTGGVLLVSLITTLVATLCFDYSLRFTWTTRESPTRDTAKAKPLAESTKFWLRRKAQRLNAFGFYCLMWSLAALPALLDWYASMISALVVYLVTWGYYFFPVSAKPVLKTALPTPDALVRAVTTLVNQASNQVAAAAAAKAAAEAQTSANQASEAAQQALEKLKVATDAAEQAKTKAATAAEKLTPPA